jgi:alginate O-acetyltransferase complex protein AlgI
LEDEEVQVKRRLLLTVSLTVNLGLLGFFKYGEFFLENFIELASLVGFSYTPAKLNIILPVGISFYTFQTLSYTLDVYFKKAQRWKSFLDFALYVTFFPQLVAGPIVRAKDFLPQCEEPKRATHDQFGWGLYFITLGLFQKVVLADGMLSSATDTVFSFKGESIYIFDAWLGLLVFQRKYFVILPVIPPAQSVPPYALALYCQTILDHLTRLLDFPISGSVGTSPFRVGCEITFMFH